MDKIITNNVVLLRANLLGQTASLSTDSRKVQNIMASGALATILFAVTFMNLTMTTDSTNSSQRGIASVTADSSTPAKVWETSGMLQRLAARVDRSPSNVANRPSDLDQLRFGALEGKYAFKLAEGQISEILFQEDVASSGDRPKYIERKDEFLNKYKGLIHAKFETATRTQQFVREGKIYEKYDLLGSSSSPVAQAEFVSDEFGRLLTLKISEL